MKKRRNQSISKKILLNQFKFQGQLENTRQKYFPKELRIDLEISLYNRLYMQLTYDYL